MKFSLNLAQKYSNVDIKSLGKDEILHRIATQLGAVEDVVDWSTKFDGVVVVRIVSCYKHPNADRLNVCLIDDGGRNASVERNEDGFIQVVCGAPNVREGMYAVWLAPGVIVPASNDSEPFRLEARELRGVISNGMLASAQELGIAEDHNGIMEITADNSAESTYESGRVSEGSPLTDYYGLDDIVIECENKMFTHRPDCFGNLGITREIAGIFGQKFTSPDWYLASPKNIDFNYRLSIDVHNEVPDLTPRLMAVVMDNVSVRPSPMWLQATLYRLGIKPINNVVDATNYIMHLTGQPLHAFDYAKIKKNSDTPTLAARLSRRGEKLTLLGQKEIELTGEEIVISTDRQTVALAGIMGGAETEVDNETRSIIIECANFNMYSIRRTSMRFGLFTDAVTRFSKGQSPLQNGKVLRYAIELMSDIASAEQASQVYDLNSLNGDSATTLKDKVEVDVSFINQRLGSSLNSLQIKEMLENVEFIVDINDTTLTIQAPFWRMDIEHPEDIVEEVGRLYGFDKLPIDLPRRSNKPSPLNRLVQLKYDLRQKLSRVGANEVLTYSFIHGELLHKNNIDPMHCYHIRNAISPDLQYFRPSITPSLLAKIHANIKAQAGSDDNRFALFEIGKSHIKGVMGDDGLPRHSERLALVIAADDKTASSHQLKDPYYLAKKYLEFILPTSTVQYDDFVGSGEIIYAPYVEGRSGQVIVNGQSIGVLGEFKPSVAKSMKLPTYSAGFEIDIEKLLDVPKLSSYTSLPNFPPIKQDVTIEAPFNKSYDQVLDNIVAELQRQSEHSGYSFDISPVSIFVPEGASTRKITFKIMVWHQDRTLISQEVSSLIDSIVNQ